jgi:hypothetical protein
MTFIAGFIWVAIFIQIAKYHSQRAYERKQIEKNSPYNPKNRKNKKAGERKVRNLLLNCYIF